jgi:hypothetical protein
MRARWPRGLGWDGERELWESNSSTISFVFAGLEQLCSQPCLVVFPVPTGSRSCTGVQVERTGAVMATSVQRRSMQAAHAGVSTARPPDGALSGLDVPSHAFRQVLAAIRGARVNGAFFAAGIHS